MHSATGRRMLRLAALAGLSALALALPAAAQANSSVSVNGIGKGSNVVVNGDARSNSFLTTWVKRPKILRVQDLNGGTIDSSEYCTQVPGFRNMVDCKPVAGSKKIKTAWINYGEGNDVAPRVNDPRLPTLTINGGPGSDSLRSNEARFETIYGGPGNDAIAGSPYGDLIYGGAPDDGSTQFPLADPFGADVVFTGGGTDFVIVKDLVGGDYVDCVNGQATVFADAGKDVIKNCGNVL